MVCLTKANPIRLILAVADGTGQSAISTHAASFRRLRPALHPDPRLKPPAGPDWVHEIKHDGYRLQVRRDGDDVRLFTRRGYDWTGRYPAIAGTAAQLRARSFTLDGEAVVCGPDGVAVFDALHRRGTVSEAMLYAFDLLELDGEDLRGLPLGDRKKRLARLLGGAGVGIVLSEHTDRGRRDDLPAGLPHGPGGHRVEAAERALPVGPVAGLAQGEEPGQPGDGATSRGPLVIRQPRTNYGWNPIERRRLMRT